VCRNQTGFAIAVRLVRHEDVERVDPISVPVQYRAGHRPTAKVAEDNIRRDSRVRHPDPGQRPERNAPIIGGHCLTLRSD